MRLTDRQAKQGELMAEFTLNIGDAECAVSLLSDPDGVHWRATVVRGRQFTRDISGRCLGMRVADAGVTAQVEVEIRDAIAWIDSRRPADEWDPLDRPDRRIWKPARSF